MARFVWDKTLNKAVPVNQDTKQTEMQTIDKAGQVEMPTQPEKLLEQENLPNGGYQDMTTEQLNAIAKEKGLDLRKYKTREKLIDAIEMAD